MDNADVKPHILVWGINYSPEETGIAPYNTDLCDYLRERGCEVSMLTAFSYYPHWRKRPEDRWRLFHSEEHEGVKVERCGLYVPSFPTAFRRILHEASFATISFLRALFLPKPSAILVVSPPLLLGPAARILSWVKGAPYFFHVQDMQPDAAVAMGFLRPGFLTKVLYRLESIAYYGAVQVSGITTGMVDLFKEKGVPPSRSALFPNWEIPSGKPTTPPAEPAPAFRERHGFSEDVFLLAYSGNLGRKQGISILLEAAETLRDTAPHVQIIIAGDGGEKEVLQQKILQDNLPNVKLLPLLPTPEYQSLLREADICVVTQQKGSGALFFPSKLLRILSAERAVLAVADETSELDRAVREGKFGVCVPPAFPEELAAVVKGLAEDPGKVTSMAARSTIWMRQFDREKVLNHFYEKFVAHEPRAIAEKSITVKGEKTAERPFEKPQIAGVGKTK